MGEEQRSTAREIACNHLKAGDPLGWFEDLYSRAGGDTSIIPWADLKPNPNLIDWLEKNAYAGPGKALKVGCGLGDDAEELTRRGFETTAFDISASAIAWCRRRYPQSSVSYAVKDLFSAPAEWKAEFHFVLESYTLQVLPPNIRAEAARCIAALKIAAIYHLPHLTAAITASASSRLPSDKLGRAKASSRPSHSHRPKPFE
jgi:SAM-dependent methyltransferase